MSSSRHSKEKVNLVIRFAPVIINSQLAIHYSQFAFDLIFRLFGAKEIEYPLAEGAGSAEEFSASSAALREKSLTGVFRITKK